MSAMRLVTLDVSGAPYELGLAHGRAFAPSIASYAAERMRLAAEAGWTGRSLSRREVLGLARECLSAHESFAPRLIEELRGVAAGAGIGVEELIVAGGFTDFIDAVAALDPATSARRGPLAAVDDCTAFLVPGGAMQGGSAVLAQTWDMHEGSAEHLVLLRGRPADSPDFIVYTTAGCLGMIGMNEAGLSVGINNLMAADGGPGVTWPFAVRAMLEMETLDDALDVLADARLAGGHNYLVLDAKGDGANVEAMPTRSHTTRLGSEVVAHTNHCLSPATQAVERQRAADSQASSEARLADAYRLLDEGAARGAGLSLEDVQGVTADTASICHRGTAPLYVATCGAVVMRPAGRELWAAAGMPSSEPYVRFTFDGRLTAA